MDQNCWVFPNENELDRNGSSARHLNHHREDPIPPITAFTRVNFSLLCITKFWYLYLYFKSELLLHIYFYNRYKISLFHKDYIMKLSTEAIKSSLLVNMVSASYVEVSQKHILSRFAGKSFRYTLLLGPHYYSINTIKWWSATWARVRLQLKTFAGLRCETPHRLQCISTLYTIY